MWTADFTKRALFGRFMTSGNMCCREFSDIDSALSLVSSLRPIRKFSALRTGRIFETPSLTRALQSAAGAFWVYLLNRSELQKPERSTALDGLWAALSVYS